MCAFALAGCAGQVDLSKSVSNRTTVKAGGGFGDDALRQIEPCGLLNKDVVAAVGKASNDTASRTGYSECSLYVTDTTGKVKIGLGVKVGESLFDAPKQTNKQINGLVIVESRTSSGCSESAVTGRDPDRGVTVSATADSGDTCDWAGKAINAVINLMATNPPKYPATPGSLVTRDPCADLDDKTAAGILGKAAVKSAYGIRSCSYTPGSSGVTITVSYDIASDPYTLNSSSKPVKVDLTDKVKGAAQWKDSISDNKCDIGWAQRQLNGGKGENVEVSFERSQPVAGEDVCAVAKTAAVAVAGKVSA
ncbi:hypothetical protein EV192_106810 [Actinocrispum wychmicini]|uniref:DUF3558 domain-containing protein n=2 Tax=Actinocrispum wychmicini TaxID=1213861 RepID=A0A4R2JCN2_9PSEU|nr:hypothetical protein EV192_106810 [Actinocrispum wychmicini]